MTGVEAWSGPLPPAVRARVVALAADALGALAEEDVPAALRRYRSWTAQHRRTRAGTPLATAVERDAVFRQRVAAAARQAEPDLAAALTTGAPPAAADPVQVAALGFLVRTPGWPALIEAAAAATETAHVQAGDARLHERIAALEADLAAHQERHAAERAELRRRLAEATAEALAAAKSLREEKGARRRAERAVAEADASVALAADTATTAVAAALEDARQAHLRAEDATAALESSRRAVRDGRSLADVRTRLLLDTVVEAAAALRRELALPPAGVRPADLIPAAVPGDSVADTPTRALLSDDPALLDQLVALPQAHLVVDGYNVTKSGFPELSLEQQRVRLLTGLSNLAARSGAEVTCCFDGAALEGRVPAVSARGVRVLFSRAGETADELIRRLVRAEPTGRPVCVVSSDREVADGVRRAGARPVAAMALVRRLDRG